MARSKKENRRREPKVRQWDREGWKSLARTVGLILLACVVAVGIPLGGYYIYEYLIETHHFDPKNIRISGNTRVSDAEILDASGLQLEGVNLMELNASEVCERIETLDWIEKADLKVTLPDTVMIQVIEREPLGIVNDSKLYVVDREGHPIKLWTMEDELVPPVVSGAGILDERPEIIRKAFEIADLYEAQGGGERIDEIHYDDATGFSLFLGKTEVRLGYDRFDERLERYSEVSEILSQKNVIADYILLDSGVNLDQVVVRAMPVTN